MNKFYIILFFIICTIGCNKEPAGLSNSLNYENHLTEIDNITLRCNDTLSIGYHDTLSNHWENLWITFDSLLEDSRCEINVWCWWEGNACLKFKVCKNKIKEDILLNTYYGFTRDTLILKYKISLIEVLPVRYSDSLYTPDDYVARIYIEKQF